MKGPRIKRHIYAKTNCTMDGMKERFDVGSSTPGFLFATTDLLDLPFAVMGGLSMMLYGSLRL